MDLTQRLERDDYEAALQKYQGQLGGSARRMTDARCSAVLVFEGADAAGKGGCIRRIVQALDARFYRVIPIAAPTDEERVRPYLWRFWRTLPCRGQVASTTGPGTAGSWWNGSKGFAAQRTGGAYAEINAFEEQLHENGMLVAKFWLAIGEQTQLERFKQREATGYKRYKLTPEDWRNREKWPAYEAAVCDMVEPRARAMPRGPWSRPTTNGLPASRS